MKKEFEMGDSVFCIKEMPPLKQGCTYKIKGFGDLTWNIASGKHRFGYGVGLDGDYGNPTFFTEEEMYEHFLSRMDYIRIKLRDDKINQLLDLDKYN